MWKPSRREDLIDNRLRGRVAGRRLPVPRGRSQANDGKGYDWDANWLIITGHVESTDGTSWTFTDPCLTTTDARALGQWLRDAAAGNVTVVPEADLPSARLAVFTKPVIALSLAGRSNGRIDIRFHLSLQAAPARSAGEGRSELFTYFITLALRPENLLAAVDEWDEELAGFPER